MSKSIKYRPEIDGLRTLAVLSVVIFHAEFLIGENEILLSGGFLGVDVFFCDIWLFDYFHHIKGA